VGSGASLRTTSAHVLLAPESFDVAGAIELDEDAEHHLRRVLRLRDGEVVSVTDGAGRWRLAVAVVDGPSLRLSPDGDVVVEPAPSAPLTIAVAMPKGDRLDWLVQKSTELGADRLVLLHADRSVVRWKPERARTQRERLQRISDEACRQSRRVRRVVIEGPVDAGQVLDRFVVAEPGGRPLGPTDRSVAVGPEGGWSPEELELAPDRVSLGPNILRTETAVVAIAALCVTFER
jgi:16S rRNA (uracil1498-N3)-methyltransferase